MKKYFYSSFLVLALFLLITPEAQAGDLLYLDKISYPIVNNINIASDDGKITLQLIADSAPADVIVKMMSIVDQDKISNFFAYPDNIKPASDLYFIRFVPGNDFSANPNVTLKYKPDNKLKEVYYFDWVDLQFKKIDAIRDLSKGTLYFKIPEKKEKLMFAIFDGDELTGKASWYVNSKYPTELMTASRDFPINSKLKVINADNNKEVIVTVKDYGPKKCADWTQKEQESMGPCQERVVDLSKTAFQKIASLTQGIINVIIRAVE